MAMMQVCFDRISSFCALSSCQHRDRTCFALLKPKLTNQQVPLQLVAVAGVKLLVSAGLGQREGLIVALSLGIGLGLPTQPGLLASLPGWLHSLLESGISAGGLTALLLNLLWRAPQAEE